MIVCIHLFFGDSRSLEKCLCIMGHFDNVVKGGRQVGSLDLDTVEFIKMYDSERRWLLELRSEVVADEACFEVAWSRVLGVERSFRELGSYHWYRLDTGLFD